MPKVELKNRLRHAQNGRCEISGDFIPVAPELYDTDRIRPKAQGGIYTDENTRIVTPVAHMKRHNILRERDELFTDIKGRMDSRRHMMNLKNKINNQILAMHRGVDSIDPETEGFLNEHLEGIQKRLDKKDRELAKVISEYAKADPLAKAALGVRSIGPITVAYCLTYIDLEKARHASCLWSYAGLHKPSHERYEKGVAGGGNKTLRTALYTMADSQVKGRGPYREIYDQTKERLSISEKTVNSRNTQGKMVEVAWKDTKPCHRNGAALRVIMKHFLADYWYVGRTLKGLPTDALYVEAMLGKTHRAIRPEERGWKF